MPRKLASPQLTLGHCPLFTPLLVPNQPSLQAKNTHCDEEKYPEEHVAQKQWGREEKLCSHGERMPGIRGGPKIFYSKHKPLTAHLQNELGSDSHFQLQSAIDATWPPKSSQTCAHPGVSLCKTGDATEHYLFQ